MLHNGISFDALMYDKGCDSVRQGRGMLHNRISYDALMSDVCGDSLRWGGGIIRWNKL